MTKKAEQVFVTANNPSIHYNQHDYFHLLIDGSDGWKAEVVKNSAFVDRWLAEQDPTILQIIPYVICITEDNKILSYQRKGGGEGRLEGKHSIGIGGHVNDTDCPTGPNRPMSWDIIINGAVREVSEELDIDADYVRSRLREIGTVYVPSDDGGDKVGPGPNVGEVHIGVVYTLLVTEHVTINDNEGMIDPVFLSIDVAVDKYELWSQKILAQLDTILELTNEI